jgi:light-regulated signal transduction histidine kinase (bacteriophytochrome)
MTALDITHPDDRAGWAQGLHDLAAHKVDSYHQDKRYTHAGGHRAHASVIGTDAAQRQRAVVYVEDITERRAAEERLQAALTELEQRTGDLTRSNEELEQFAYVASHDLQEPLRMVSSYTNLLAEDLGDSLGDDARRYLDFAHDGAVRMQQLVTDLLQYSRVGRADTVRQRVDCDQLVETATVDLQEAISAAGATVTHDPLPPVIGVKTELRQLFTNLIGNAVKFRGAEPVHVHVGAARAGPMWRFSVADNGIGIDPGQAERIFEVFKRLHTRGRYPGTGIGLAICKKVVEHHGGRIWVESQPGAGATFRFTLPAPGHDQEIR